MGVWQGLIYRLALSKLMKLKTVRIMGGSSVNNELLQHMLMGHIGKKDGANEAKIFPYWSTKYTN